MKTFLSLWRLYSDNLIFIISTILNMKKHLLFLLQSVMAGLALAFVYLYLTDHWQTQEPPVEPASEPASYAQAVQKIAPAVVSIYIQSNQLVPNTTPGVSPAAPYRTRNYTGSGVIVTPDGHIATNKHIIKDAVKIYVSLWNNLVYEAFVVGRDEFTDLAVIKIQAQDLVTATFANSEEILIGDVVLAIGNPFGLNQSVSLGIVSATGRKGLDISRYENFIQTDAAINQGNSGGALVNAYGALVGLGTATYSQRGAEGISFAIPANTVQQVVNSIVNYGEVRRGWFGLSFYHPQAYVIYGIKRPAQGVRVSGVHPGSVAAQAGIRSNDVVTHINGETINSFQAYNHQLWGFTVGDEVELQVLRNNRVLQLKVTVEPLPQSN